MDRRIFIRNSGLGLGAVLATTILGAEKINEPNSIVLPPETVVKHFDLAIAGLIHYIKVSEIADGLMKIRANGFTETVAGTRNSLLWHSEKPGAKRKAGVMVIAIRL